MSDTSSFVIETSELTKKYPNGTVAVDGLDLRVPKGEVYGLLGPNGSGKTTTILILTGLTEATSGSVQVLGLDPLRQPLQVKRLVAYMPDSVGFYPEMTALENIDYTSRLAQIPAAERDRRIDEAMELMGLGEVAQQRVGTYSRGMRQRLALAEVLVKEPRIAILDEPTQGLDPESAHEFLELVESLREKGITVLLSSHLLDQVQRVCDRVGLFYRGRLVLEGTVHELTRQVMGDQFAVRLTAESSDQDGFRKKLQELPEVTHLELERHSLGTIYREHLAKERAYATT